MVVDAVLGLVGCACKSKTMNATVYCRILLMVEEVQSWLRRVVLMPRLLDSEAFEKNRSALVNALCTCSLFLAGECMSFHADLVCKFCLAFLKKLLHSSSKDLFPKKMRCCVVEWKRVEDPTEMAMRAHCTIPFHFEIEQMMLKWKRH
ncbi:hypothetical protein Taro_032469 [Colocasia esculenta]|uniref:Separase-like TPR repeats region domain-containing protein n=1 Tax=Colocasia esculenta TaxID=4460 RepID=A0A843W202_COLES|nr:hypothetical protein [Colocasia esculenta]